MDESIRITALYDFRHRRRFCGDTQSSNSDAPSTIIPFPTVIGYLVSVMEHAYRRGVNGGGLRRNSPDILKTVKDVTEDEQLRFMRSLPHGPVPRNLGIQSDSALGLSSQSRNE